MIDIISKIITYAFVVLIYFFIFNIIRLVYLDIKVMSRKKAGLSDADAYLKLINLRHELSFPVEESYGLKGEIVIGRGKKNTIAINDPYMSKQNTRIYETDDAFYIEDLNSTNGTFLNGEPVTDEALELFDGDKIKIGQVSFLFLMPVKLDEVIA